MMPYEIIDNSIKDGSIEDKQKAVRDFAKEIGLAENDISDSYHSFNELYEFRKQYNAALFNEWAKANAVGLPNTPKYNVHKSLKHNDGELCFGGGWFIVAAITPFGMISNHYKVEDWDLFKVPEYEVSPLKFDGHTPKDVVDRLELLNTTQFFKKEIEDLSISRVHPFIERGATLLIPVQSQMEYLGNPDIFLSKIAEDQDWKTDNMIVMFTKTAQTNSHDLSALAQERLFEELKERYPTSKRSLYKLHTGEQIYLMKM